MYSLCNDHTDIGTTVPNIIPERKVMFRHYICGVVWLVSRHLFKWPAYLCAIALNKIIITKLLSFFHFLFISNKGANVYIKCLYYFFCSNIYMSIKKLYEKGKRLKINSEGIVK